MKAARSYCVTERMVLEKGEREGRGLWKSGVLACSVAPLDPLLAFVGLALAQETDLYRLYHLGSQAAPTFQLASANGRYQWKIRWRTQSEVRVLIPATYQL